MDKFYFVDLLRKDYSSFKIFKFSVGPANAKGENYASQMFRVKVSIETNQPGLVNRSFMVKVNHTSGPAVAFLKLIDFFPKEIEMYSTYLPKFESMYKAIGEEIQMGARLASLSDVIPSIKHYSINLNNLSGAFWEPMTLLT